MIRLQKTTPIDEFPLRIRGRVVWSPMETRPEQTNLPQHLPQPSCWEQAHHDNVWHLRNHPDINPAIQLSSHLRIPGTISLWCIILIVTTNNPIPHKRQSKISNHTSHWHWTYYLTYGILLGTLLRAFCEAFPSSVFRHWFTIFHLIILLYCTLPNWFCVSFLGDFKEYTMIIIKGRNDIVFRVGQLMAPTLHLE